MARLRIDPVEIDRTLETAAMAAAGVTYVPCTAPSPPAPASGAKPWVRIEWELEPGNYSRSDGATVSGNLALTVNVFVPTELTESNTAAVYQFSKVIADLLSDVRLVNSGDTHSIEMGGAKYRRIVGVVEGEGGAERHLHVGVIQINGLVKRFA